MIIIGKQPMALPVQRRWRHGGVSHAGYFILLLLLSLTPCKPGSGMEWWCDMVMPQTGHRRHMTTEVAWVRWAFIILALLFMGLFLVITAGRSFYRGLEWRLAKLPERVQ